MTNKTVTISLDLLERLARKAEVFDDGSDGADAESARSVAQELRALLAAPVVERQEPVAITDGMDRLIEAHRLGEFRLEGGSPTVEAMSCASYDDNPTAVEECDFDSYSAGYQAAMYEQVGSLLYLVDSSVVGKQEPIAWVIEHFDGLSVDGHRTLDWPAGKLSATPVGTKLYTSPPAPVAVDAAKAFAKGFNLLEQEGGKYRITMAFQNSDDAFDAYRQLAELRKCLDKAKGLNQ